MPNAAYQKGYRGELHIKDTLKSLGYVVTRSAASHGPWDVVGVCNEHVLLIQAKRGKDHPTPCDWKTLTALGVGPGVIKMVVWLPDGGQARVLYCVDQNGPCDLPYWCASKQWLPGLAPKQRIMVIGVSEVTGEDEITSGSIRSTAGHSTPRPRRTRKPLESGVETLPFE